MMLQSRFRMGCLQWSRGCCSQNNFVQRIKWQHRIRTDSQEFAEALQSDAARFLLFHKGMPLIRRYADTGLKEPLLADLQLAKRLNPEYFTQSVFLKTDSSQWLFALPLSSPEAASQLEPLIPNTTARFVDHRLALFSVDSRRWGGVLSQAWSLLRWLRVTKFCSSCGGPLTRNASGSELKCDDTQQCGITHHPTQFPVGIVLLVSADHSKVLLARQPTFPPGLFTCVAGYVDPGETLMDCITREAAEEVGVQILSDRGLQLMDTQFWPFPTGSFMMGCMAFVANDAAIDTSGGSEIEEARWFDRAQVMEALRLAKQNPKLRLGISKAAPGSVFVPPPGAIAHDLLCTWLQNEQPNQSS